MIRFEALFVSEPFPVWSPGTVEPRVVVQPQAIGSSPYDHESMKEGECKEKEGKTRVRGRPRDEERERMTEEVKFRSEAIICVSFISSKTYDYLVNLGCIRHPQNATERYPSYKPIEQFYHIVMAL